MIPFLWWTELLTIKLWMSKTLNDQKSRWNSRVCIFHNFYIPDLDVRILFRLIFAFQKNSTTLGTSIKQMKMKTNHFERHLSLQNKNWLHKCHPVHHIIVLTFNTCFVTTTNITKLSTLFKRPKSCNWYLILLIVVQNGDIFDNASFH